MLSLTPFPPFPDSHLPEAVNVFPQILCCSCGSGIPVTPSSSKGPQQKAALNAGSREMVRPGRAHVRGAREDGDSPASQDETGKGHGLNIQQPLKWCRQKSSSSPQVTSLW